MHRGDRELCHEPKDQKGCPPDFVRAVGCELNPGLSQGVQLQREVEPGPLDGYTTAPENRGGGHSLDEVVESGFRSIGAPSMQHQRPLVREDRLRISADQISQRGSARVIVRGKVIDLEQRIALTADDPHRLGIALPHPAGHEAEQQAEDQGHRDKNGATTPLKLLTHSPAGPWNVSKCRAAALVPYKAT